MLILGNVFFLLMIGFILLSHLGLYEVVLLEFEEFFDDFHFTRFWIPSFLLLMTESFLTGLALLDQF